MKGGYMANYYTYFSVIVPLSDEAAQAYAMALHQQATAYQQGDALPADFPVALFEVNDDWRFEAEIQKQGLWLHSTDGGIDAACLFIQHLLARFHCAEHVGLEWSNDCDKPRPGAFGGGAAFITAENIECMNTGHWLQLQLASRESQPTKKGESR
jgi:hypothetical protein